MNNDYITPSISLYGDAMLADAHACDVDRACRLLSARDYGDCYAYVDAPTGCAYVVGDRAMAALGRMLADDTPDAYVAWSTTTGATAVDPHVIVQRLSAGDDLDDLRARADACADFITVVAIDLLRPTLEAILAYDADAAAEEDANDEAPAPGSDTVGRALY